ncbi:MAG: MprA protease, GlyGly-CTERM protein-sorting domain-containing form [Bacteroidota bacterium]|nr:MprA protease, GlyGly-CTERM protein-sorting domain-containing form [Bacteroidota bacterium]
MFKYFIFTSALLLALGAKAQAPADGGPAPTGPTAIPLDGGASLLLAGGLAYGLRRLRRKRRNK